ncbi:MFS transporter [Shuttleworthella satelles]|uniref:MFS transporter n=1 Tax=Shuttleworthella satelles TaxID=177972 RepID=UPI0028D40812|nr:MFS transporter [Shuttleworthia satelles]
MKSKFESRTIAYYLILGLLMLGLGSSDALRGVFAPVFREHFALNTSQLSLIITISYIGNFVFMLLGGRLSDHFGLRRAFCGSLCCWIGAEALYLLTGHYPALLVGVFFAMGTSTLLNMLMNIMSPRLFTVPGAAINILFFIQAIGTTLTQGGIGRLATSFFAWKLVSLGLLLIGVIALLAFARLSSGDAGLSYDRRIREEAAGEISKKVSEEVVSEEAAGEISREVSEEAAGEINKRISGETAGEINKVSGETAGNIHKKERAETGEGIPQKAAGRASERKKPPYPEEKEAPYIMILHRPAFWLFILIFGTYFIGEHGVMNWMNIYCRDGLGMSARDAALIPSLFYGGMMLGRLLFAPVIAKLKIRKALLIFLGSGTGVYILSFVLGQRAFFLLFAAGLGLSVIYPTMTLCIQIYFHRELTTTATGAIMSAGTLFDIAFNAIFGLVIARVGYGMGMMILPLAMCLSLGTYLALLRWGEQVREL